MSLTVLSTIADNFGTSLVYLVQGMAGIFVFMGLFYAIIFGLEKMFKDKPER